LIGIVVFFWIEFVIDECNANTISIYQSNKQTNNSVWTKGLNPEMKTHVPPPAKDITYLAEIDDIEPWTLVELSSNIQSLLSQKAMESNKPSNYYTIVGCIAGGEAGVDMADALSEHIGVLSNGTQGDFCNRRDKKVQQDLVRRSGMRAVRQECGSKWEDVVDFLMSESFPVVRIYTTCITHTTNRVVFLVF
jgi:hypothetical protein